MRTTKYTYPAAAAFGCGLATLVGAGTSMAIIKSGLHSSEAATWIGALGTVGAVVAALWIATAQERSKRTDSQTSARVTASGMLERTQLARAEIDAAATWFHTCEREEGNTAGFHVFLERLEKLPTWTHDELVRLAPVSGNCAYKLAAALDKSYAAIALIRIAVAQPAFTSNIQLRLHHASALAQMLTQAKACLDSALDRMRAETSALIDGQA